MTCPGSPRTLDLEGGAVLALDDAKGTTLRVTRGVVWLTQHHDSRDIVLTPGDAWTVERDGRTVLEAQAASTLCLYGEGAAALLLSRTRRRSLADRVLAWLGAVAEERFDRRFAPYV